MGISYKAIINKNNRDNKSGRHTIYIRVIVNTKAKYLSTGEKVDSTFWVGKENQWVNKNCTFSGDLNRLIRSKILRLQEYEYRQKNFQKIVTLEMIEEYHYKNSDSNIFNDYLKEYMKKSRVITASTLKKYQTFEKNLNEFNGAISFRQLDDSLFQNFALWLQKKGLLGITIHKYFQQFRVICKHAVIDGYMEKDPFIHIKIGIKATKGKRVYLEIDEITKLKNKKLPDGRPELEQARMHWLFCFYGGFLYSDLKQLKWENIKSTDLGYVIVASRYKNTQDFIVPVHRFKHAVEIIEKQKGKDDIYVFPNLPSVQKYNEKLKELAGKAEINKNIMNKTARHSNIQFWEAKGLETQHVQKMVGHTDESTTAAYFDLTIRDINSRVERFDFTQLDI